MKPVLLACFLLFAAPAVAADWYVIDDESGKCELTDGPANHLKRIKGYPVDIRETKSLGRVVEVELRFGRIAQVRYIRGLDRCEDLRKHEFDKYR